jgi:hypothetical protein
MDMTGKISVKFFDGALNKFCRKYIPEFDTERFEIAALRIFAARGFTVTVYALDKFSNKTPSSDHKVPVKKFKIEDVNAADLPQIVEAFNFTLAAGNFELDEIEVTNR